MKSKLKHLHFYSGADDSVLEVFQYCHEVETQCDEIFTEGLGPCIGVAFSCQGRGYMFHSAAIHHSSEFDEFLDRASARLTALQRQTIRPVVAGGDRADDDDVLSSRDFCLDLLHAHGFGKPHVLWNPDNGVQALYLDVRAETVRVHTETSGFTSNSEETVVEFKCRQ